MKQALNATFFGQQLGLGNEALMALLLVAEILVFVIFILFLVHLLCTTKRKDKRRTADAVTEGQSEEALGKPIEPSAKEGDAATKVPAKGPVLVAESEAAKTKAPEKGERQYRGPVMVPPAIVPMCAPDPRPGAKGVCRGFAVFPPTVLPYAPIVRPTSTDAPAEKGCPAPANGQKGAPANGQPIAPVPLPYAPLSVSPMRPVYLPIPSVTVRPLPPTAMPMAMRPVPLPPAAMPPAAPKAQHLPAALDPEVEPLPPALRRQ